MTAATVSTGPGRTANMLAVLARGLLGAAFIYMGLNKTLHPVEFLKLMRQYDMLDHSLLLNLVAATLPWLEIFCGLLVVLGIAIRGAAVVLLAMLVPFTVLVLQRALALHEAGGVPFCAIKFDCGCGTGEVLICRKLMENSLLMALSAGLIFRKSGRHCLHHSLL